MKELARLRLQIRAVLVVYRAEMARAARPPLSAEAREQVLHGLRARSLRILDRERALLDGQAAWHPELLAELLRARAEVATAPRRPGRARSNDRRSS